MFYAISVCVFRGAGGVYPVYGAKLQKQRQRMLYLQLPESGLITSEFKLYF